MIILKMSSSSHNDRSIQTHMPSHTTLHIPQRNTRNNILLQKCSWQQHNSNS
eukprot:c37210_g1_i1 orf=112-267(-)